jgi:hypothetical protein
MLTFTLRDTPESRAEILEAVMNAEEFTRIVIGDSPRTIAQNRAMWPILTHFAEQRKWLVNGEQVYLSPEDWKDILTAGFKGEGQRIAEAFGDSGKRVLLGVRTSKMGKAEFSRFIEYLHFAAAVMDVDIDIVEAA